MSVAHVVLGMVGVSAFIGTGLLGQDRPRSGGAWPTGSIFGFRRRNAPSGRRMPFPGRPTGGHGRGPALRRWSGTTERCSLGPTPGPSTTPGARQGGSGAGVPGRLALGRVGRQTVASERAQSVIVFGPTQSHKTSGLAVPAILGWEGPVIAASIKADLLEHTMDYRRRCGSVHCYDPTGSTGLSSEWWSPLPAARTWPGARRVAAGLTEVAKSSAGTMSDGDFWYATAAKMLAPLLFAAAFGQRSMDDVVRWVETCEEGEVLDLLAAAGVPEAVHSAGSMFGKEDRQRSSIYTTVETILEPFADGTAGPGGTGRASVDRPGPLVEAANTLYLCAPAHDQRRLTPLFVSVVRQSSSMSTSRSPEPTSRSNRRYSWCWTRRQTSPHSPTSTRWRLRLPATGCS